MRPFDEDYEYMDEFEFDSFAATTRLLRDKQHRHKLAGRRFRKNSHKDRWENDSWDPVFEYEDYEAFESDKYSGIRLDD